MDDPERDREAHPSAAVTEFWNCVVADAEATAAEYREAGWTVTELHPGDVTPVPARLDAAAADRVGLDVLVPDAEFEAVERAAEDAAFDASDAFRAERDGAVFAVVVMRAKSAGAAVTVPVYYTATEARPMLERVVESGEMRIYVRPLSGERRVVFAQNDPGSLVPDGGA